MFNPLYWMMIKSTFEGKISPFRSFLAPVLMNFSFVFPAQAGIQETPSPFGRRLG